MTECQKFDIQNKEGLQVFAILFLLLIFWGRRYENV
jgi:hypothetical protein